MPSIPANYELIQILHKGVRTHVVRARRSGSPTTVVLKLSTHPTSSDSIIRLRHEFEITRGLNSPRISRPAAFIEEPNACALVFGDIGAISLRSELKGTGRLEPLRATEIALDLAAALAIVHAAGVVHKDVKPGNALIDPRTRTAVLSDFSIAARVSDDSSATRQGAMEGTLEYLAPEQTGRMNRPIDHRADFYGLGVTLYELLVGQRPFRGSDPMQLVHAHLARTPKPPHERVEVPLQLSRLVLKLMAKEPAERYQTARGLQADLQRIREELRQGEVSVFPLAHSDRGERLIFPSPLFGRDEQRAALDRAVGRVAAGTAEFLIITGYSGMGKSALLGEAEQYAATRRGRFAASSFDQVVRAIPHAPILDFARALCRQLLDLEETVLYRWRERLRAALGKSAGLLTDVIPELETLIGPHPMLSNLGTAEVQRRFQQALGDFLGLFAEPGRPLVVTLDDLHWADKESLRLIEHCLTVGGLRNVLFVGARRRDSGEEAAGDDHVEALMAALRASEIAVTEVELGRLNPAQVTAFIAETLGCDHKRAEPLAAVVSDKTRGNPFFISRFVRALVREGLLRFDGDEYSWSWELHHIAEHGVT
ncbi:MAG: AAA family ATPase, partial [Myxococcota bacterium]